MPEADPTIDEKVSDVLLRCLRRGSELQSLGGLAPGDWQTPLRQAGRYSLGPLLYQRPIR